MATFQSTRLFPFLFLIGIIYGQSANVTCIEEYCGNYAAECEIDYMCRNCLSCVNGCMNDVYPNDKSFEHWSTPNCTSYCIATYGTDLFYDYNQCLTDHDCVTLVPITDTCLNSNLQLIDDFEIDVLTNPTWMIYGMLFNTFFDELNQTLMLRT